MSEEKMAINFAINSMELADVFRKNSSEEMKVTKIIYVTYD